MTFQATRREFLSSQCLPTHVVFGVDFYVSGRSAKQRLNTRPETAIHDTRSAVWNALILGVIHA
jgi:hypothetical protein